MKNLWIILLLVSFCSTEKLTAQTIKSDADSIYSPLEFRFAGPTRGGRSTAVCGIPTRPHTFFMGSTGGGIWKTDDAGHSWENVSDGYIPCGSIGSIAVAPSADYMVYAGTGSGCPRGNVSIGCGMYKSEDGGESWKSIGLNKTGQIAKIIVHPKDPDIVYAACLGNPFSRNVERGVFKTTNGGESWEKVLFLNDSTGAVDLALHPENPNILFAGMWRTERKPWTLIDGGDTGGLYKTTDAGGNWEKIKGGLPQGEVGRIGIAISPANPKRMWVLQVTGDDNTSGLYRSDDGGKKFSRICRDHKLTQRAWYYTHVFADPDSENAVYVCNVRFYKSIDGGKTFDKRYRVPHGDTHDLWINPDQPDIMINANDGGASISLNDGDTWSAQDNQPTPELYRLTVDNQWPYRMYAGQQDNSTISVPSRRLPGIHPWQHWMSVGGGESADVAVHPENPNIVYATTYSGIITRTDLSTGEQREIGAYPHYTEGTEMRDLKYRWQWNFPIRVSKHDPNVLYMGSNYVHRSTDDGHSWQVISPDLSRAIDAYFDIPGGPVQHDATGVEVYGTVFALVESPDNADILWAGTDDGRMHVTKNKGSSWEEITPKGLPTEATINHIFLPEGDEATAYIAAYNYRYGDFKPYVYMTSNFGKKWSLLTTGDNGIPKDHFTRCVVEDPVNKNLLFAGTEFGLYTSFDKGKSWQSTQYGLPNTPITDMEIVRNELVLSTQGRGFWILEGLEVLRADLQNKKEQVSMIDIPVAYRSAIRNSVSIRFQIPELDTSAKAHLEIIDSDGKMVQRYSEKPNKKEGEKKLKVEQGLNQVTWDKSYLPPTLVEDLVMMDMRFPGQGPQAPPGKYQAILSYGELKAVKDFDIEVDPRWEVTTDALKQNFSLASEIRGLITESQENLIMLRSIRKQIEDLISRSEEMDYPAQIKQMGDPIIKRINELEESIYQTKVEESQDEINYERKFTNHLIRLYRVVISENDRPTAGQMERWQDVQEEYKPFAQSYTDFLENDLKKYQEALRTLNVPLIMVKVPKS